jgi:hypothetical protein
MNSELPITEQDGMFSVMLRPCTSGVLAHILAPFVPFVWIRRHMPHRYVQWCKARVPLSATGQPQDIEVRSLEFELQLSTGRFLELLPEFEEHGMDLCQMTQRVPNTLTLNDVSDAAAGRILIQNGLHLRFYLPHAVEFAQLASPHREVLEGALQKPQVRELACGKA